MKINNNLKYRIPQIKSLNMLKMEKNFIAQEKGYSRQPYNEFNLGFWIIKLKEETKELIDAITNDDIINMKEELADISNLIDYAFETVLQKEIKDVV